MKGSLFIAVVGEKGVVKVAGKKICTRQSQKVMWDMINTLFLTLAVKPTFVGLLKQTPTYLLGLSCHSFNFLWRRVNSKPATIIPFGIVACTFSDNLSRNSCMLATTTLFPYSPLCGWPTTTQTTHFHVFHALSARFKMERS